MDSENTKNNTLAVVGIGELLWDVYPDYRQVGGAPANFAFHTQQLGAESWPVSCVGQDDDGDELRDHLTEAGVNLRYVQQSPTHATGTVAVQLHDGKPTYHIIENVAWDHIHFPAELEELAERAKAVCFGSLSQRSSESRKSIRAFVAAMPATSIKIFDVNLRPPHVSKEIIRSSLDLSNVLKLSDEELPVLRNMFHLEGNVSEQLRQLVEMFDLRLAAYTRGALGSLIMSTDMVCDFPGTDANVVDTVGAGDSFTAALCMGILYGWPLVEVNEFANKVAAYVCSQKGATPRLPAISTFR
ncbi:MAG: carbohydrate kinase family protein [Puniceicoccales bacterium]